MPPKFLLRNSGAFISKKYSVNAMLGGVVCVVLCVL